MVATKPAHYHLIIVPAGSLKVMCEALEIHLEGLKEAKNEATKDRTIEEPDKLLDVTADFDEDIARAKSMLEVLRDRI